MKHVWLKGQRGNRSMINVMFSLLAKRVFPGVKEDELKRLFARVVMTTFKLAGWRLSLISFTFVMAFSILGLASRGEIVLLLT